MCIRDRSGPPYHLSWSSRRAPRVLTTHRPLFFPSSSSYRSGAARAFAPVCRCAGHACGRLLFRLPMAGRRHLSNEGNNMEQQIAATKVMTDLTCWKCGEESLKENTVVVDTLSLIHISEPT